MHTITNAPRRVIHTQLKILCFLNQLPEQYKYSLHRSQIHRYQKHFNPTNILGAELSGDLEKLKQLYSSPFDRKTVFAYLRIVALLRKTISSSKHFSAKILLHKKEFAKTLISVKDSISIDRFAKYSGISSSTLRTWISSFKNQCSHSYIQLCYISNPNQLLSSEVVQIKKLLSDPAFFHWPLVSVYYYALHNNIVSMAVSTWYKYTQILNITRPRPKATLHPKTGIHASRPNQYWHADVTQFRTTNGVLHYIYLVVDNFSRKILAWKVDTKLSAAIRTQTFRDALKVVVLTNSSQINLVVDGGSENNNKTVDEFISSIDTIKINKIRALRDVHFSNAMAEATNRLLKTYYLNKNPIAGTIHLYKQLEYAITDINTFRPHGKLSGLTPDQVCAGALPAVVSFSDKMSTARKNRIENNRKFRCSACRY